MTSDSIYSKRSLLIHDYFLILRTFETLFPQLMQESHTVLTKRDIKKKIAEVRKLLDILSRKIDS
ncbi:MAG: hypothetical protein QY314_00865 [Candidatus Dojkabacteria bacterium]|nr:MAG: hypothetical protein QY314_00865 [Candidatus Dojkabacteria bacterium]